MQLILCIYLKIKPYLMIFESKLKNRIYQCNILHRCMPNPAPSGVKLRIRGCKIIDQLYISLY